MRASEIGGLRCDDVAEVRAAAGHSSLVTTSAYLQIAVDDEGQVGGLFGDDRSDELNGNRAPAVALSGTSRRDFNSLTVNLL